MKLLLIPALVLGTVGSPAPVRFEADGIRVGADLVTGAAVSLKEAGSLPLLVSGSAVESLSGDSLAIELDGKQLILGAGLRLARVEGGYSLTTHGMPFTLAAGEATISTDRAASFKLTEKGFDFGALGTLDGVAVTAKVLAQAAQTPPPPATTTGQDIVSPEKSIRQNKMKLIRRMFYAGDPLAPANAASSYSVRMIPRVTPDGAP